MLITNSNTAALFGCLLLVALACAGFVSKDKSKLAVLSTVLAVVAVAIFVIKQAPIKHNIILPPLVGTLALIVSILTLMLAAYQLLVWLKQDGIDKLRLTMIPAFAATGGLMMLAAGSVLGDNERLRPAESYSSIFPLMETTGAIFGNVFLWLIPVPLGIWLVLWLIDRRQAKKAERTAPTSPAAP